MRRHERDWTGGFYYLLDQAETDARDVSFQFDSFVDDQRNGERMTYLGALPLGDTVDSHAKTVIEGPTTDDILSHVSSVDSAVVSGGEGNDELRAGAGGGDRCGGAGNDQIGRAYS